MELKNVIFDMLVEEVRNKKLLNSLLDKWKGENPEITPQNVEYIMTRFMGGVDDEGNSLAAIKDKLNPKKPQVIAFLQRFDGEYGTEKFEPNNLKNIASYSYSQIKSLFLDFEIDLEERVEEEDPFFEKAGISEEEKIAASRDMWMGNKHLVYDNGNGFRIYKPRNQKDSISFGYWQESIMKNSGRSGNRWCITWEGSRNMWRTYRSEGRTYYFIIDETKDESDIHFLGVLQPKENVNQTYPFKLTNLNNTGDKDVRMVDNDFNTCITCIYPQLREPEAQRVLERVPFDPEKELNVSDDEAQRINEREGDRYEFRRVNRNLKLRYITNNGVLRKMRSFESMDENLIRTYFEQTTVNNVGEKFQSYDVFKYITKKSGLRRALQDKMSRLADENGLDPRRFGIGSILTKLISTQFKYIFISQQDPDIRVMEQTTGAQLVGILNTVTGQWVELDGIKYEPEYEEISTDYGGFEFDDKSQKQEPQQEPQQEPEMDQEDGEVENLQEEIGVQKAYLVHTFSKTNSKDDNSNFYVIRDIIREDVDVTILSHKTWLSVGEPAFRNIDSDDYDPENPYVDIDTQQLQKSINEKGGI